MHYCNDCKTFVTPILSEELYTDVCPECGSQDLELANKCKICGQPVKSNEDYCEDHLTLAGRYILELATQLGTTTDKARDLLMAVIEKED